MRTPPSALATHYQQTTTTISSGLKVTRADGIVYGFTSNDVDATISGVLYKAKPGLSITNVVQSVGLNVDNLELIGLNDQTVFIASEVYSGLWKNAAFELFQYNWKVPADGRDVFLFGTFGEIVQKGTTITIELRGIQQFLQQPIGKVVSKLCRARLGDAQCTVQSEIISEYGTITAVTDNQTFTVGTRDYYNDRYWAKNVLVLDMEGADTGTVFTDYSPTPKTATVVGGTQTLAAQFKYGATSAFFNGTNASLTWADNAAFEFGSGDFTIEFWMRPTQVAVAKYVFTKSASTGYSPFLVYQNLTSLLFYSTASAGSWSLISGAAIGTVAVDTWYHVAVTRRLDTVRCFLNGVLGSTTTLAAGAVLWDNTELLRASGYTDTLALYAGYIDDLRLTKGAARYVSAFTPPVAANVITNSFSSTAPTEAVSWFVEGIVEFLTGANVGYKQKIKTYTAPGVVTMSIASWSNIAVGDTVKLTAGCQKRHIEDCKNKFNNILNFDGEPHVPGPDKLVVNPVT